MTIPIIDSFRKGLALFDAGQFHPAHDAWEDGWRAAHGPRRAVLQTLILWAAALHQQQRGKAEGARRLLAKAMKRLGTSSALGLAADDLRDALADSWAQLDAGAAVVTPCLQALCAEAPDDFVELDHRSQCPYCGEPVLVSLDAEASTGATYVEDCPVCCRPWTVVVSMGDGVTVQLKRGDE